MNVGDYTTELLSKSFVIERKSPVDLYGTVLAGHKRFRRALLRAREKGIQVVVAVECTERNFFNGKYEGAEYQPYPRKVIKKIIATMKTRYCLEFVWCKNRKAMAEFIAKRLQKEERKLKRNPKQNVSTVYARHS